MATPTPTQAEANTISANLYAGLPPPTLAHDGSPIDAGSVPGGTQAMMAAAEAPHAPAHTRTHATHTAHAPARPAAPPRPRDE